MSQWESALAGTLLHSLWEGAAVALGLALVGGLVVTFTHFAPERPVSVGMSAGSALRVAAPGGVGDAPPTPSTRSGREFYFNPDYLPWIVTLWFAGVLISYLRGVAGWMAARRLRLTRPVVLLEPCLAEVPVVMSYVRPVILMPAGLVRRIRRLLGRPEQRFASAMPLVTAVGLALCLATAMVGWQAAPPAAVPEPDAAPVAAPAPAAPSVSLPDHKILPNDLLSIMVYDEPELSRSVRVDADGKIAMPQLTEKLQAAGLMPRDIEKEVSSALVDGQILLHPAVTVAILEYAERSVSVVGDVKMPGQFRITSPISLLEALAKAGWVTNDAGPDVLLTTPDSPTPRKIGLRDLQMSTDRSLNVMLTGGETISVPDAKQELVARFPEGPKVWITGNVSHPLVYSITNPADATVLKVMASTGGEVQYYAKTAWIYRRDGADNRRSIPIPLSDIMHRKAQDVTLQADDILFVPDSDTKKMQEYYDTHPLTPPWEKAK